MWGSMPNAFGHIRQRASGVAIRYHQQELISILDTRVLTSSSSLVVRRRRMILAHRCSNQKFSGMVNNSPLILYSSTISSSPYSSIPFSFSSKRHLSECSPLPTAHATIVIDQEEDRKGLREQSRSLLRVPMGKWTEVDLSMARFLLDRWGHYSSSTSLQRGGGTDTRLIIRKQAAQWLTRIVYRWLQEMETGSEVVRETDQYLLEIGLHRTLHAWMRVHTESNNNSSSTIKGGHVRQEVIRLVQFCHKISSTTNNVILRPGDVAYSMVFSVLAQHPQIPGTSSIAESMMQQRCQQTDTWVAPDLTFWNSYLHALAECSPYELDIPERIQAILLSNQFVPDGWSWTTLVQAWARSGQSEGPERAQSVLEQMKKDQLASTVTYYFCIDAWARIGCGEQAERLLFDMVRSKDEFPPNPSCFMAAINGWGKSNSPQAPKRARDILNLQQRLYDSGITALKPTTREYTAVMHAFAQQANSGPEVQKLLHQMEETFGRDGDTLSRPSLVTYTTAIHAWAKTDDHDAPEHAEKLVRRIEELFSAGDDDVRPGAVVYNALILAWAASNRSEAPQRALSTLRYMGQLAEFGRPHIAPNIVTYNAVITAFARGGDFDEAAALVEEMEQRASSGNTTVQPNAYTYSSLLYALRQCSRPDSGHQARYWLERMITYAKSGESLLEPTESNYVSAILAQGTDGAKATDLLWLMHKRYEAGESQWGPNTDVCNAVLLIWSKSNEAVAPERTMSILSWMEDSNRPNRPRPDLRSYNYAIRTWTQSKRRSATDQIRRIMKHMALNQSLPDGNSYQNLLTSIRFSKRDDKLCELCDALQDALDATLNNESRLHPRIQWFHCVIDACAAASPSDDDRARDVLRNVVELLERTDSLTVSEETSRKISRACDNLGLEISDIIKPTGNSNSLKTRSSA